MTDKATKEQREAATHAHGCEGCATEHGDSGLTPEEIEVDRLRAEVAALKLERLRHAWGATIKENWDAGTFMGPCAHGRDPYTRCDADDVKDSRLGGVPCEDLEPRQALEQAVTLAEREACAKVAEGPGVKLNDSRRDVPQRYRDIIADDIRARGAPPRTA